MARSRRIKQAGNILQRVGRALSGKSSGTHPRGARKTKPRQPRRERKNSGAKGLLRRLLG